MPQPIQVGAPATIAFSFRDRAEDGSIVGPIDLTNAAFHPLEVVLRKPDGSQVIVAEDDLTITDPPNGAVEWRAEADEIDQAGIWKAQAWAGPWPSKPVTFTVDRNL